MTKTFEKSDVEIAVSFVLHSDSDRLIRREHPRTQPRSFIASDFKEILVADRLFFA